MITGETTTGDRGVSKHTISEKVDSKGRGTGAALGVGKHGKGKKGSITRG